MIAIPIILVLLIGLYLLAVRGRKGHPGLQALHSWSYAHRGLHDSTRPENSMSAFRAAVRAGYGIELDVHLLKDGTLAIMHDSELKRTTGCEGRIEDLTADDLDKFYLEGTFDTIPTFQKVLETVNGKVPLVVELKAVGDNYGTLCQTACEMLENYNGIYCMESFDPRCVHWLKKHKPQIIRGQLSENFVANKKNPLPWILKFVMTHHLLNFLTLPDFVAYRFSDRKRLSNFLARKLWGVQGVTWTLENPQEHEAALAEGWIPIFENYTP